VDDVASLICQALAWGLCTSDCHALCGNSSAGHEVRVDVGPHGRVVAVLEVAPAGFPSVLFVLNGRDSWLVLATS
jgi:hypothetical protein